MSYVKFPPPRPLTKKESLDSLDHWKSQFRTFFKRDDTFKPFLKTGFTWDPTKEKFGFTGADAEETSDDFQDFLNVLSGFLPHSYLTSRIQESPKTRKAGMTSGTLSIPIITAKSQVTLFLILSP